MIPWHIIPSWNHSFLSVPDDRDSTSQTYNLYCDWDGKCNIIKANRAIFIFVEILMSKEDYKTFFILDSYNFSRI